MRIKYLQSHLPTYLFGPKEQKLFVFPGLEGLFGIRALPSAKGSLETIIPRQFVEHFVQREKEFSLRSFVISPRRNAPLLSLH